MKIAKLFISIALAVFTLASCGEIDDPLNNGGKQDVENPDDSDKPVNPDDEPKGEKLEIVLDKKVIRADGKDVAVLTYLLDGNPIVDGVTLYDGNMQKVTLEESKFTTDQVGEYEFWAAYATLSSESVIVRAVNVDVPATPVDPKPSSTAFDHKVLQIQITGNQCGFCPLMIESLGQVYSQEKYASRSILAACHTFNSDDPTFIDEKIPGSGSAPKLYTNLDFGNSFGNLSSVGLTAQTIAAHIDEYYKFPAKAGISVKTVLDGNTIVIKACVKAAVTTEFRVGAWLLEDGLVYDQHRYKNGGDDYYTETHDNCVRIADSKVTSTNYLGHSIGLVNSGETSEYVFVWDLDSNPESPVMTWNKKVGTSQMYKTCLKPDLKNCRVVVFASVPMNDGPATTDNPVAIITNVVECPLNGEVQFCYVD